MDYKVLIKVYVPKIEETFEMYIPVNQTVKHVITLMNSIINDITGKLFPIQNDLKLCNRRKNTIYKNNQIIRDTDIRNGTELVLF